MVLLHAAWTCSAACRSSRRTEARARTRACRATRSSGSSRPSSTPRAPRCPQRRPASDYGRLTQGAADAILASLYLNAGSSRGTASARPATTRAPATVSGGKTPVSAIDAADRVINSGVYSLATDWQEQLLDRQRRARRRTSSSSCTRRSAGTRHEPRRCARCTTTQLSPAGRSVERLRDDRRDVQRVRPGRQAARDVPRRASRTASTPASRSTIDREPAHLHAGHQRTIDAGERRTRACASTSSPPMPSAPNGDAHPNDFPFFRLAEMYLIKAEALNELGQTRRGASRRSICVRARALQSAEAAAPACPGRCARRSSTSVCSSSPAKASGAGHDPHGHVHRSAALQDRQRAAYASCSRFPRRRFRRNPLLTQNAGLLSRATLATRRAHSSMPHGDRP